MSVEHPWSAPGVALCLPERTTLNTTLTTATAAGQIAGVPVPENASKLVVSASGDAPAAPVQIRTQRGGLVGLDGGCTLVWRPNSTGTWYGTEAPTSIHDARLLTGAYEAATTSATASDVISLADGAILVVNYREAAIGPGEHRMETRRIEPDGTTTTATVFAFNSDPGLGQAAAVQLQNGRVLLFTAVPDAVAEVTQIRCDYSDDGGLTWANAATACLRSALNNAGSDYQVYRMSAAAVDSTVCLIVTVARAAGAVSDYRDVAIQYASRDDGATLSEVYRTDETSSVAGLAQMADVSITTTGAALLCAVWVAEDGYLYRRILGSPYDPLDATPPTQVDGLTTHGASAVYGVGVGVSVCADDSGKLWATTTGGTTDAFALRILSSSDGGQTWGPASVGVGGLGYVWRGTAGFWASFVRLASFGGRLALLHGGPDPLTFTQLVGLVLLGRTSDITLPPYYASSTRDEQIAWVKQWAHFDPEDWRDTTENPLIPGGTVAFGSGGYTISTAADARFYRENIATDDTAANVYDRGVIRRYVVAVTSGGSLSTNEIATRVRIQAAGDELDIVLRHTTTGARLFDIGNGVAIGADVTGLVADTEYEWMIVTNQENVATFYRLHTFSGEQRWNVGPSGPASSAGAGTFAIVDWGHLASSTSVSRWRYNGTAYGIWTGQGYEFPYQNPRDLTGRAWPSRASVLTSTGAAIRAYGLSVRGDSWVLSADSDVRLTNALVGGPRRGWEAPDDSEQVITLDLATHDTIAGSDLLVISGFGSNVGAIKIEGVNNAGTSTTLYDGVLTTGIDGLHFSCNADRVLPATATAGTNAPTFARHELAGCQWSHYAGGAWRSFTIRDNREGKWTNATTARTAILVDGALPTAGAGTDGRIVPASWAVHVSMRGAEYRRIRITIPAPNTSTIPAPAGGRWKIGRLHVGYAQAFCWPVSHGDRITHEGVEETVESRDGQRTGLELAPTRRRILAGFVDGTSTFALQGSAGRIDGSPPHFAVDPTYPVGLVGYELLSLDGVLRATRGARELVWLCDLQPTQSHVYNRRDQLALVYLDSDTARERFSGYHPVYGDAMRGDVLELVEAV